MHTVNSCLIDARSPQALIDCMLDEIRTAKLLGLDCETQDENRHPGLEAYNNKTRHVFDHRRTVMTGFSIYVDGSDTAWYVNLAHADVENRLGNGIVYQVLEAVADDCLVVAHNAPFEIVMFSQCHGVTLKNIVCTLQLAVSHHGSDEYDPKDLAEAPLTAFKKFTKDVLREFAGYEGGDSLRSSQQELLSKFIAKESKSEHSYNGFVKSIAKGYNLKRLVQSTFGVKMTTYEEVLKAANAKHMGELTGEQVVSYGADDAYWAVEVYKHLRDELIRTNPKALVAFLKTENPMVQVYADSWKAGIRLDLEQVYARREAERANMAKLLRDLKPLVRSLLPFPDEPHEKLVEKQGDWYVGYDKKTGLAKNNWKTKRAQITAWANSKDQADDFAECYAVSNPIGNAWAAEKGLPEPKGRLNITYYQTMRVILHDLMGHKLVYIDGEVSSDKDARGKVMDTFKAAGDETKVKLLTLLQDMAEVEQRMKLYLTPYTQLMDPDTGRVYPVLSSQLATRRLATSFPNPMQLAKRGNSQYIRGFYLADTDDHVVISADWSSVELVLIGDQSGDPAFAKVFGQLPYGDLHSGAAADCLAVKTLPGLTEEEFKEFKFGRNPNGRTLLNIKTGLEMDPASFFKMARTDLGKVSNFGYWYSGALSTVGGNLGWTSDEMWEAVDRYRARFAVAEQWRVGVGNTAAAQGFITLPDGHTRVRFEATDAWAGIMRNKFADLSAAPAMLAYADLAIKRLRARAKNQAVNAMIQGTCAALAKRSILRLIQLCADAGISYGTDVRLMMPVHDELIFSVHKGVAVAFIALLRKAMSEHPEIVTRLPLDCTVAVGRTFQPFDKAAPIMTQIELDEAFPIDGVIGQEWEGKKLTDDKVAEVLEWITTAKLAA